MKKILLLLVSVLVFAACGDEKGETKLPYITLKGETMGTTYSVIYNAEGNYQDLIDQLLKEINSEVNTYDPNAFISKFNASKEKEFTEMGTVVRHFFTNFEKAKRVHQATDGYFDPTVMPLVSYWGFGKEKRAVENADVKEIQRLKNLVGLEKITTALNKESITVAKENAEMQLDFSALAKGYGVDQVAKLLEEKGVQNYLVEIGGETVAKGVSNNNKIWSIGINTPSEDASPSTDFEAIIQLENKAIATSGNYRNYYEVNGKKYAHSINPKTGYSEMNSLLSASVIMDDCMTADAYATSFMIMGLEKAWELAEKNKKMLVYFIYDDNGKMKVKYTAGLEKLLVK